MPTENAHNATHERSLSGITQRINDKMPFQKQEGAVSQEMAITPIHGLNAVIGSTTSNTGAMAKGRSAGLADAGL